MIRFLLILSATLFWAVGASAQSNQLVGGLTFLAVGATCPADEGPIVGDTVYTQAAPGSSPSDFVGMNFGLYGADHAVSIVLLTDDTLGGGRYLAQGVSPGGKPLKWGGVFRRLSVNGETFPPLGSPKYVNVTVVLTKFMGVIGCNVTVRAAYTKVPATSPSSR